MAWSYRQCLCFVSWEQYYHPNALGAVRLSEALTCTFACSLSAVGECGPCTCPFSTLSLRKRFSRQPELDQRSSANNFRRKGRLQHTFHASHNQHGITITTLRPPQHLSLNHIDPGTPPHNGSSAWFHCSIDRTLKENLIS